MLVRLNPRIPVVWRTPDSLQVGIDAPIAVFDATTPGIERLIAVLRTGAPLPIIEYVAEASGASAFQVAELLRILQPALLAEPEAKHLQWRVVVDGTAPTAQRISGLLGELGIGVSSRSGVASTDDLAADAADLAVVVGYYALPPERYGRWLRRDIPHLPVVFSDTEIRVGPLIEPGTGPCLGCLELSHIDADAAWPAIAIQLLAGPEIVEDVGQQIEVSALVAGWVIDRLTADRPGPGTTAAVIDSATGSVTLREHRPHEHCGCRSLTENVTAPEASAVASPSTPS
ncbi:hypothetical protein [Leifsonia sp. A12D58]|uniref:hypothetical protein n=1 Tax=Leifsonia sp. A12D58 TaxID=3397674 RepID=UPI0039E09681